MPNIITKREINEITAYDPAEASRRRKRCSAFKARIKSSRMTIRSFSSLIGVSEKTAYSWTSSVPPHPLAMLILSLIEHDKNIISALEAVSSKKEPH
jgi:hypothetical protein